MLRLLVTQKLNKDAAGMIRQKAGPYFEISFLAGASASERRPLLERADVILSTNLRREIEETEFPFIVKAQLVQVTLAGADTIPYSYLKPDVLICSNGGAYSDPIAEHAVGMMLALARNFLPHHRALSQGVFDQKTPHKMLSGSALGIVGFGGIGRKISELAGAFGMRILAVNSTGKTDRNVGFIGTLSDLDTVLRQSDFLVLTIALNKKTRGIIGSRELNLMKPDAVLVNVARGDLIDEKSLYEHLRDHPHFKAGIEAWWIEPFNHPKFEVHYPFFELPNLLASPHNSYLVDGGQLRTLDRALDNVVRFARGERPSNIQRRDDYI